MGRSGYLPPLFFAISVRSVGAVFSARFEMSAGCSSVACMGEGNVVELLRSHRGRPVWDFVREQRGHLWFPPAYAPELNPVEYLWSH